MPYAFLKPDGIVKTVALTAVFPAMQLIGVDFYEAYIDPMPKLADNQSANWSEATLGWIAQTF